MSQHVMSARCTKAAKDEFYRQVGERIAELRENAGMSPCDLARATGVNSSTIGHAEDGTSCSLFMLAMFAEALDVSLDSLVPVEALR